MEWRLAIHLTVALSAAAIALKMWTSSQHRELETTCECNEQVTSLSRTLSISRESNVLKVKDQDGQIIGLITTAIERRPTVTAYEVNCLSITDYTDKFHQFTGVNHTFSSDQWFGGPQYYTARWPINKHDIQYQHYVSDDLLLNPTKFGSIMERYWLSTQGLAVYFTSDAADLYYGVNEGQITLGSTHRLGYIVCKHGKNMKDTHQFMIKHFLKIPMQLPDLAIMKHPIWSTWVRYKTKINEEVLISFAKEINSHGFKGSQIEIDDTYTTNYGDMEFDKSRFPNPSQMIEELKSLGFRVTSWVHPFVNFDTIAFKVMTRLSGLCWHIPMVTLQRSVMVAFNYCYNNNDSNFSPFLHNIHVQRMLTSELNCWEHPYMLSTPEV